MNREKRIRKLIESYQRLSTELRTNNFAKLIEIIPIDSQTNTYLIFNCLFFSCSKRIVNISKTEDDVHLVHREMANGKQTKSVQVDFDHFQ